jgi:uncharacterized membrane protein YgcG
MAAFAPLRLVAFLLVMVALAPISRAQTERILDYNSDVQIRDDGSMVVTETIRVQSAGDNIRHGIYRDFPSRYSDRLGNRYFVGFDLLDTIRDGAPEAFHLEELSNGKRIYLGHASTLLPPGEYTYVLRYSTDRQLGFFRDHDELFWNVTGNGWIFRIDHASATVHFPLKVPLDQVTLGGYTGPQGSMAQDLTSSRNGDSFEFAANRALLPRQGLSILLMWPKGYFTKPSSRLAAMVFASENPANALAVTGLGLLFLYYLVVWFAVGRDPARGVIVPLYEPPAEMSPAAIRYLVRMGYDNKAFAAAVLDMAVKGFLTIKEEVGTYTLTAAKASPTVLSADERSAATELFEGRSEILLRNENHDIISAAISTLKLWLKTAEDKVYFVTNSKYMLPAILGSIALLLGMVTLQTPQKRYVAGFLCVWLSFWSIFVAGMTVGAARLWGSVYSKGQFKPRAIVPAFLLTLFSIPFMFGEVFGMAMLSVTTSVFVSATLLLAATLHVLFHYLLKAPTHSGRAILDKVEGFKMFLSEVDGDRWNRVMPPEKTVEVFEKFLPYALALDVEQAWTQKFASLLDGASHSPGSSSNGYSPTWCSGAGWSTLGASGFADSLSGSFTSAISSSASAPGSNSGSSGGAGGSGGGGGGGGGGGW